VATSEVQTFGTDLAFDSDLEVTPTGDLDTISGLANFREAVLRRIFTSPGSVIHRPNYGVGLKSYLNNINSLSRQQALLVALQTQLPLDPRVDSVTSLSVNSDDDTPGQVTIVVSVQPVGYTEIAVALNVGGI
jgi:phage baseplate assembly protein W